MYTKWGTLAIVLSLTAACAESWEKVPGEIDSDAGVQTDGGNTDGGVTPASCNEDADCSNGGLCLNGFCSVPPRSYTLRVTSKVSSQPEVFLFYWGAPGQELRLPSQNTVDITDHQLCNTKQTLNGNRDQQVVKLAARDGAQWWDCEMSYTKLSDMRYEIKEAGGDWKEVAQENLVLYNDGRACGGQGPGDLFILPQAFELDCSRYSSQGSP